SEIVPAPIAVRESLPVIVNFSNAANALGWDRTISPVVHGKPMLVAMLVSVPVFLSVALFAIRPVVFGMLNATTPGEATGKPGVVNVVPPVILPAIVIAPPAAARLPGWAGTFGPRHELFAPPNTGCLHGSIAPRFSQTPMSESTPIRVCADPPK